MTVQPFPGQRSWLAQCILGDGKNAKPLPIVANALLALRYDSAIRDAFAYDEISCTTMLMHGIGKPLAGAILEPRALTDEDVTELQEWLQGNGLKRIARETVRDAISLHAHSAAYHPVRDYLEALQWDGQRRTNHWLTTKLGAELNAYTQAIGQMFLIS